MERNVSLARDRELDIEKVIAMKELRTKCGILVIVEGQVVKCRNVYSGWRLVNEIILVEREMMWKGRKYDVSVKRVSEMILEITYTIVGKW